MTILRRLALDGFTLPGASPSYAPDLAIEPRHIEVRLAFDLKARSAEGSVTTTVRCNRAGARALRLDAIDFEDLSVEGPQWRYDGSGLDLFWEKPFAAGEERAVTVRYRVEEPISGLFFSGPEKAYPDRPRLAWTDHETERARYWLPCVDYPAVRTTFDFFITAPKDLTVLANGDRMGAENNRDSTQTVHWRLDSPCPSYLCCIALGEFTRFDDEEVGGRPLAHFASQRFTPTQLETTFGRTPEMMRWLEKRLGRPFPYSKYFQVALPAVGGAMENISLVTWDDRFVLDADLRAEFGHRIDSVVIHEMAHSYFGDDVVCRHFDDAWLKESWAVYVETAFLEQTAGRETADHDLYINAAAYMGEADKRYVRPISTRTYNSSWDMYDRHLYPGGAMRLHMLRHLVGDEVFWKATRDYLETFSGKVVETADFRKTMERHSGLNLNRFFDQWFFKPGYPKLKASLRQDREKGEATLAIEQTQIDEERHVPAFSFPLEVAWQDDAGKHLVTLELAEKRCAAVLPQKGNLRWISIDPDAKALFALDFNPGHDLLKALLGPKHRVCARIRAAAELIRTGKRPNLQAVAKAMEEEPFWGVRAAVAKLLGESGQVEAIAPLAAMLGTEQDPRARVDVAAACGKLRDPRLRRALLDFLAGDPLPRARAQALMALGAQRDPRDLMLLETALEEDDLHRIAATGALKGLGAQATEEALEILSKHIAYGAESDLSRPAAVEAFGACAGHCAKEVRERATDRLIDLTRDKRDLVRRASAKALADLQDPRALPAIESLKKITARQAAPALDRLAAKIRKGAPGSEVEALRSQLEKLEERTRKLDERLQDLEAGTGPASSPPPA